MKRLKLIGPMLLALFALGAFVASSAFAEEGFLVGGNTTPTLANILGGVSTLETAGGATIACEKLNESHIQFENDKHAKGTVRWVGCKAEGLFEAISLGDKASEILLPVIFLVCLDTKDSAEKLLDNFGIAAEVNAGHLEIPALGVLVEVNGLVIGRVLTSGLQKLFTVDFTGSKGAQSVASCKEGENLKKHSLNSAENHLMPETASENVVGGLVQFPANTELMDK